MTTPLYMTNDLKLAALADLIAGALTGAEVALYQSDTPATPSTPLGDYTLADYDGYAPEAITWLAPSIGSDGEPEVVGIVGEFRPTGTATPNVIYGALVTDGAGTTLYAAARLENPPAAMGATTDSIIVTVCVRFAGSGLMVTVH